MSRSSLFSLAALALFVSPAAEIEPVYAKGTTLEVKTTTKEALVFDDVRVIVNGQEMGIPDDQKQIPEDQTTKTTRAFEDEVLAAADGKRTRVRRSFTTLEESSTGEDAEDKQGPLQGLALILALDDDGELTVEPAGDDEVDSEYLERHRIEYTVEAYLPTKAVEVGDTWELDEDAVAMLVARGPRLFEMKDEEAEFTEMMEEATILEGTVTYVRDEERDGRKCAVLEVEFEFTNALDGFDSKLLGFDGSEMGFGDAEVLTDYEMDAEGTTQVWIALDSGHPVAEEESVESSIVVTFVIENEEQGVELKIVTDATLTVTGTTTWSEGNSD